MSENDLKPSLRFKGFTDAWEQRKFDDVVSRIGTGLNPRQNFTLNTGGKNYYVTIKNFQHGQLNLDDKCDLVDDEALKLIQNRSDLQVNDILFASIGRIGDCYLIDSKPKKWNINESVFTLRPNTNIIEPKYLFHTIHSNKVLDQILNDITGSTFKSIKVNDLRKISIPTPSKEEQKRLAEALSNLDTLITLHQRKYEKLQSAKKSLLEKMFPNETSNKPKIRFKDFTDAWEQRKVKEIGSISTGKSNTQDQKENGKYPFYIRSDIPVRSDRYLYDCEAVITIGDGNIGKVFHYVKGKFDLHQRCYKISDFNDVDGKYFYYYFSTHFYERAIRMTAKTSVDSVRLEMISEMVIFKPMVLEEQIKIAKMLTAVDSLITLHQRKYEKLQNIKKSLLERMFI